MSQIKIAILDMNNDKPNQGLRCIRWITEHFLAKDADGSFTIFNVRAKNELPNIADYDIFISSGGPGEPYTEGHAWEQPYYDLLDGILEHNKKSEQKKFLFLICHSFQIACMHWDLGQVTERQSYSFGILAMHMTEAGKKDPVFENLPDPFYAVDSRQFQVIQPKLDKLSEMGAKITALEKIRPHVELERAIMAIRFTPEIFGTQFHPEADAESMQYHFLQADRKNQIIEMYGEKKYFETIDRLDDEDKILTTQEFLIANFLRGAATKIAEYSLNSVG